MNELWLVVLILPLVIVPSLFIGFELPLYLGMGLLGTMMWLYVEDPALNFIGSQLARVGFILFVVAFMYYFFSGSILGTQPFEFRFLKLLGGFFMDTYRWIVNTIGNTIV